MRIRHIAVHPAGRGAVPPGQPGQHRPQQLRSRRARPDPRRSRRRTDPRRIASASGNSRRAARGPATTTDFAAQWLVLITRSYAVEVELLDRGREEGQVAAGSGAPPGAAAGRTTCGSAVRFDAAARPSPGRAAACGCGAGKELGDRFEHLFAAAHAGQPVVHERDAQPVAVQARGRPRQASAVDVPSTSLAVDLAHARDRSLPRELARAARAAAAQVGAQSAASVEHAAHRVGDGRRARTDRSAAPRRRRLRAATRRSR